MGGLWESAQDLQHIRERVADEHDRQNTEKTKCVHGVGNNFRLRSAWRNMIRVIMSVRAWYMLRVCTVWKIFCDQGLPVGARQV